MPPTLPHLVPRHACCAVALALLLPAFGSAAAATRAAAEGATRVAAEAGAQAESTAGTQSQAAAFEDAVAEAQAAQASGHYAAAATAYRKATALNPSIPELWANRGLMEHLAGEPNAAIASFAHALAARPTLFTAVLFTGIDLAALNQPARAVPFLDRALRLQPANPDALIALGKADIAIGHLEGATSTLERAVAAAPTSSAAWFSLAVARLALIDRDGGRLARDHATDPWSQALYAQDLLIQGRTTEAVDAFHQAATAASPRQRAVFTALLSSAASSQSELPAQSTARALAAVEAAGSAAPLPCPATSALPHDSLPCSYLHGDARAAATSAATLLRTHPDDTEALFWSVKANEPLSVAALSTFERLAPQSPATFDLMGDLYRHRLQPDQALTEYTRALSIDPQDASALLGAAAAYLATSRLDQAIATARTALSAQPDSPRLNLLLGEALVEQHHFTEARPPVERALSSATSNNLVSLLPSAHALLGQIKAEAGDIPGAIADLTLGLPSDTDGSLSFRLSRLYRKQGQLALATETEARGKDLLASRRVHAVTAVETSSEVAP